MTRHAGGRRRSRGRTEDRPRAADVRVHTRFGYPQETRDLFRREPARDGAQDFTLPIGQRGDGLDVPPQDASGEQKPKEDPDQSGSRALHSRCKRPRLALRSARALQCAALVGADYLVLETLEEKLPAAARTKRLVTVVPDRGLAAANVVVGGAKLLDRRPARARGDEHLAEAVAAEIAVELSSKGHVVRNLHR